MAYQPKPGSGTLFINNRRETDTHPHLSGSILLPDGKEYWFSGWIKQGKDGGNDIRTAEASGSFISVSIGKQKLPKGQAPAKKVDDDSVPF